MLVCSESIHVTHQVWDICTKSTSWHYDSSLNHAIGQKLFKLTVIKHLSDIVWGIKSLTSIILMHPKDGLQDKRQLKNFY